MNAAFEKHIPKDRFQLTISITQTVYHLQFPTFCFLPASFMNRGWGSLRRGVEASVQNCTWYQFKGWVMSIYETAGARVHLHEEYLDYFLTRGFAFVH